MNYRPLLINKFKEFEEEFPNYTFGELMYSMFTHSNIKGKIVKSDFLKVTDQDFYTMIEKAIEKEKDE